MTFVWCFVRNFVCCFCHKIWYLLSWQVVLKSDWCVTASYQLLQMYLCNLYFWYCFQWSIDSTVLVTCSCFSELTVVLPSTGQLAWVPWKSFSVCVTMIELPSKNLQLIGKAWLHCTGEYNSIGWTRRLCLVTDNRTGRQRERQTDRQKDRYIVV